MIYINNNVFNLDKNIFKMAVTLYRFRLVIYIDITLIEMIS